MKQYYKEINGKKVWFRGILITNEKQIINPTEEQILAAGYIEYIHKEIELTEELKLTNAINIVMLEIYTWDNSNAVNSCKIIYKELEIPYWASKSERNNLKAAVKDYLKMGKETYRLDLRNLNISVTIPCEDLLNMLSALEVYAIDCYNKTTDHIYAVNSLTTVEEVESYDYTIGYPEILIFKL